MVGFLSNVYIWFWSIICVGISIVLHKIYFSVSFLLHFGIFSLKKRIPLNPYPVTFKTTKIQLHSFHRLQLSKSQQDNIHVKCLAIYIHVYNIRVIPCYIKSMCWYKVSQKQWRREVSCFKSSSFYEVTTFTWNVNIKWYRSYHLIKILGSLKICDPIKNYWI